MRTLLLILIYCFITIAQPLSIELSVDSAFYINNTYTYTEEEGKSVTDTIPATLFGQFSVKITNTSDTTLSLLLWDEGHNVRFSSGDSSVVLVHQCSVMGMNRARKDMEIPGVRKLTLRPHVDTTITYKSWECSSPFRATAMPGFYEGGEYNAQFQILPYDLAIGRKPIPASKKLTRSELITRWEELLNSNRYWEDAFLSNKVTLTIPVK